jgi:predicted flap endonuclease-1-like 5' DNA nuclease
MKSELQTARSDAARAKALETELQSERANRTRVTDLETELASVHERAIRADQLASELQTVQSQLTEAKQSKDELERLREKSERIDQLERDLTRTSAEAAGLTSLKAQLEERNARIRELEQTGDNGAEANDRIARLEEDLQAARASGGAVNALRSEVDRLKGDVATRDATIASLRAQSTQAAQTSSISSMLSTPGNATDIPDYDGDGRLEGQDEGRKPETLQNARGGRPDDLKRIKGVGPALERMLNRMGFFHYDQVAAWSADEVAWVDANLDGFNGRVSRDEWVAQARILAAGGSTEFAERVDDGEIYSS